MDGGEGGHDRRGKAAEGGDAAAGEQGRPKRLGGPQDLLACEPVDHCGAQRCGCRGRDRPHQCDETDGEGPAGLVREHAEYDQIGSLGRHRGSRGEREQPQIAVAEHVENRAARR
jgi:hypothetical protein